MIPGQRFSPAVAFILVTAVIDVMAMGLVYPVLPTLIEEMSGSLEQAGLWNGVMVALWAGMQFVASPIIGSLSDRFGRRPVVLISAAGLAVDFALMALAPNLWWLALGRVLGGVTSASFTVAYAYLADITAPEKRARAFGLIGAAWSGGFVLGPLLGGLLGELGPRVPFWAATGLAGIAFIYGLLILPESLRPELRTPFSWKRANPFGAMKLLRSHRDLSGLAVVYFLIYFAHHIFSVVFVLYAGHRFGWGAFEIGLVLALWGVLDILIQAFAVGPAVKRFGDRATMIAGLVGGGAGLVTIGLATDTASFIAGVVVTASWGLSMPTSQALMTRLVAETEQGQLQGANMSVASVAGVMSPLFFGWIYGLSIGSAPAIPHAGAAFFIAGSVLGLAALIGLRAGRSANGVTPQ